MSTPQPQRSAYSMGSLPNMVRSMLVLGVIVAALIAIVPRVSHVDRPAVDAAGKGAYVAEQTGWPVELPTGLGADWVPTVASDSPMTDKVRTFTTVWSTPDDAHVALKEAVDVTPGWLSRSVNDGTRSGEVQIGSRTWARYVIGDHDEFAYALNGSGATGLTITATTTGSEAELRTFLAALERVEPAG
ncbi:MAG: DUF4245 domain-containing protein [Intrasporangium sp.]|uniref:DUF4245 domain-containing protein n=1 Tax=Intrasporangium sp. TaxID=1925024 RepID=UPI0026476B85|nr:DUF4245 domain-containing protein [Intrasporangium sp.]MDN5794273.1 DUF4245 domain-containing protein [Intrasporangium sp.]